MINGLTYDFESIKLELPTGYVLGCESVSYSDEKDDQLVTGTNGLPLGIGRGEYKGTCKLELHRFEYDKLVAFASASGGFYNMPPVPVIASYGESGQTLVTDRLRVHFTKRDLGGKKDEQNMLVTIEGFQCEPMNSDGVTAFVPFL
jgi:hypothetical protein